METYEQRQLKVEEELMDDWIGLPLDMRDKSRKEVLEEARKILGPPTLPQPMITTDLKNPEGIPEFVLDLEREVYKEGYTVTN